MAGSGTRAGSVQNKVQYLVVLEVKNYKNRNELIMLRVCQMDIEPSERACKGQS